MSIFQSLSLPYAASVDNADTVVFGFFDGGSRFSTSNKFEGVVESLDATAVGFRFLTIDAQYLQSS
jgi:hypothetical protein